MTEGRIPTDPRISRRRRSVERDRRRRVLTRLGVLAGLAALIWVAFWSPVLAVREIRVVGSRHVKPFHVEQVADLKGRNLLSLSPAAIARQLQALPWVKRADVQRILPGTVRVRVEERRPALIVALDGPGLQRWAIDARGRVLDRALPSLELPVLAGIPDQDVAPGVVLAGAEARSALTAYRRMPPSLKRRVVGLFAPTIERITFSLKDRTLVRYGAAEDLPAKNAVLRALLARFAREGRAVSYIDVRVPASPAVSATAPGASVDA